MHLLTKGRNFIRGYFVDAVPVAVEAVKILCRGKYSPGMVKEWI